jgi:hypothetical protein
MCIRSRTTRKPTVRFEAPSIKRGATGPESKGGHEGRLKTYVAVTSVQPENVFSPSSLGPQGLRCQRSTGCLAARTSSSRRTGVV